MRTIELFLVVLTVMAPSAFAGNVTLIPQDSARLIDILKKAGAQADEEARYEAYLVSDVECYLHAIGGKIQKDSYCSFESGEEQSLKVKGKRAYPLYSMLVAIGAKEMTNSQGTEGSFKVAKFACYAASVRGSTLSQPDRCVFDSNDLRSR